MSVARRPYSGRVRNAPVGGFTLIELVVVVALIGIMLLVAVPNVQNAIIDDSRKTSQWILLQVPKIKAKAASEMLTYTLHVDKDNHRLWFSNITMSEDQLLKAMEQGLALSDSIEIQDVAYSYGDYVASGDAHINFYGEGYSDKAILHLAEDGGDQRSFLFEPFLSQVEIVDGYADFED